MDRNLYVERWLLLLRQEAAGAGLDAHVRALDFKGGKWLAFAVARGGEAVEYRYRKRLTGPAMAAAATGADIAGRLREVHERLLRGHRRLLENALRRFLRNSIRLLQALEKAFRDDRGLPRRLEEALLPVRGGPGGLRPAAAARRQRGLKRAYEILPAACLTTARGVRLAALRDGRPVDLAFLLARPGVKPPPAREGSDPWVLDVLTEAGSLGAELLLSSDSPAPDFAGPAAAALPEVPWEGAAEAGGGLAEGLAEAGAGLAEGAAEAGGGLAEGLAEAGGSAVEVVSESGSACADASCAGLDCGGLDCVPG